MFINVMIESEEVSFTSNAASRMPVKRLKFLIAIRTDDEQEPN